LIHSKNAIVSLAREKYPEFMVYLAYGRNILLFNN